MAVAWPAAAAAKCLAAGLSAHLACTGASLACGLLRAEPGQKEAAVAVAADAERQAFVTRAVAQAWGGRGFDRASLAEGVIFEDPAAQCVGADEVVEVFRALRACSPETLEEPIAVPGVAENEVVVNLRQRYFGRLELRSTVHAVCDAQAGDHRITYLVERWNGVPLLAVPPIPWARRLNGRLSYSLTRLLLR